MSNLLKRLESIQPLIGNTPCKRVHLSNVDAWAKLEYTNFSGSVKDRAAYYIVSEAIKNGELTEAHSIVESSSGNFAIALMSICNLLGINFTPVIDLNVNEEYEKILRLCCDVVKVSELDETGGYLLTRIQTVKDILKKNHRAYWTDQYSNPNNYLSYYYGLGPEIAASFPALDYIFLGVSTGGTITGVSKYLKEYYPHIKVIGVDIEGSLVFRDHPRKRYISGIGASKRSELIKHAQIDDVVLVSHENIIQGCRDLLNEQAIFAGASSGASYYAVKNYFKDHYFNNHKPVAAFICPDKGNAYLGNIYDDAWVRKITALVHQETVAQL